MAHAGITDAYAGHRGAGETLGHVVPVRILVGVLVALLALTFLTVAATWVNLGSLNLWVAMLIAAAKAALVVLYFMHLRYDRPFNAVVFVTTLFFIALFLGLALLDVFHYNHNIDAYREQDPARYAPLIEAENSRQNPAN